LLIADQTESLTIFQSANCALVVANSLNLIEKSPFLLFTPWQKINGIWSGVDPLFYFINAPTNRFVTKAYGHWESSLTD
jgi:hypothetical protein